MIPGTDQFPDLMAPSGDEYLDETELALVEGAEPKARSQWQLFRRRFLRHKAAVVSTVILLILIIVCFGATWIAPYPRNEQDLAAAAQGPSRAHWMGTDRLGRDLLTEILYAGQISLEIGLAVAFLSTVVRRDRRRVRRVLRQGRRPGARARHRPVPRRARVARRRTALSYVRRRASS